MAHLEDQEFVCAECGVPVGSREYGDTTPFDGKHEIDTTNPQGGRLVVKQGQLSEYGPCGHLIFTEPFPSAVVEDAIERTLAQRRRLALAQTIDRRRARQTSSH